METKILNKESALEELSNDRLDKNVFESLTKNLPKS